MFDALPRTVSPFMTWSWSQIAPYFEELKKRPLTSASISSWLADWTHLSRLLHERFARLNVATTVDTTDAAAEEARNSYLENIYPEAQKAEQTLTEKLLASGLEPEGMAIPIKKMRNDAALFREANLPLLTEEMKLGNTYNKIIGAQTVTWKHEAGHAFHGFEAGVLPYVQQRHPGAEFSEVASMSMELLAAPYLTADQGGYYESKAEAARHRIDHLYKIITFWPYMAVVDAFQHWVYRNMDAAADPANCDAKWGELWREFIPSISWNGLEDELVTGWHRKLHIFRYPFYYVEYGMAQVGAIQVWRNARQDRQTAVQQYRNALALGGTRSLPALYRAVGAPFAFNEATMRDVIDLLQTALDALEGEL